MDSFCLPAPSQDTFNTWYGKPIPHEDGTHEVIVYPGEMLPCTSKHRGIRNKVKPEHVFITQLSDDTFNHRLYGSDRVFLNLPKRLYPVCFPNIIINDLPPGNRIRLRLTEQTTVVVPIIPDPFLAIKRSKQKRGATQQPHTRAKAKRQRTESNASNYDGWISHTPLSTASSTSPNELSKADLFYFIRSAIHEVDRQRGMTVQQPFHGLHTMEDMLSSQQHRDLLLGIVRFVYHYCRSECGIPPPQQFHESSHVQEFSQQL